MLQLSYAASCIESTLRRINDVATLPEALEVIVVDAGGSDGTMLVAAEAVASLLAAGSKLRFNLDVKTSGFGRGPTLTSGVLASKGPYLLFLHADTTLPWGFDANVRARLRDERVLATAFRFRVSRGGGASKVVGLWVMEASVHLRSKWYQLPFGDQAIAITRQRFEAVGGFPESAPIMEDFELVAKLRRCSAASSGHFYVETLDAASECSSRRWEVMGVWRANLVNQVIMVAYVYGGYSPAQIYKLYYHFNPSEGIKECRAALRNSWQRCSLRGLVASLPFGDRVLARKAA